MADVMCGSLAGLSNTTKWCLWTSARQAFLNNAALHGVLGGQMNHGMYYLWNLIPIRLPPSQIYWYI